MKGIFLFISIKYACLLLVLSSLLFSCKKFVDIDPPKSEIQSAVVFSNDSTAMMAVSGLYSLMMQSIPYMINGGTTIYAGLTADELVNNSTSTDYDPYKNNAIPPGHSSIATRFWTHAYSNLYQANMILEGLESSGQLTAELKKQLRGEVKVVRALYYFYLVNLFGDVPLITSSDYRVNAVLPRSATSVIYDQIIADLDDAKNLLPSAYPTAGRVRPNKWTATALLARVYLYKQNWAAAESNAGEVINSGSYTLVANLNNVFIMTSNETIWQMMPSTNTSNSGEGSIFIPFSATTVPTISLTSSLNNSFEVGDQRKTNWVKTVVVNSTSYTYPNKYKVRTGTTVEYNVVLRMAEQYLIRSEARAKQHKVAEAKADLNIIRARAGLGNSTAADEASLLSAIELERRSELFAEWGHRWFDLKRNERANAVLGVKPGWNPTDVLFPIPQTELDKSPFLVQNPGY